MEATIIPLCNATNKTESGSLSPKNENGLISQATTTARTPFKPGRRFYFTFGALCVINLAAALDTNTISVALPIISEDLGSSAIESFWAGTSFELASTVLPPTIASLSHHLGRKSVMLTVLGVFTIGAIGAAIAKTSNILLLGRTIQGVGSGGIISLSNILVTDLVPLRERGMWFGVISAMWAIAAASGPVIGGVFSEKASWRWIFWINLPFCGIGLVLLPMFLRLKRRSGSDTVFSKLVQIDWAGAALLTASTTSLLMPLSWGGIIFPWNQWQTLLPLFLGLCGIVGFVLFEQNLALQPLIPLRIFMKRTAAVNFIGTVFHGIILWCLLYYLPLYYEAVKEYSPILAGVAVFPETFTVTPITILVGILVSIWGRFRWAIWGGWVLTIIGMGLLCLLTPSTSIPAYIFLNLVPGVGSGLLFSSTEYAIQAGVDEKDVGYASAMFACLRSFGQSIGIAIGGMILQSRLKVELESYPSLAAMALEFSKDATSLIQTIKAMPKDDPEKAMLIDAYANSLKVVWLIMAGLAFVAFVFSLWTEELNLNRELETEQGFIHESQAPDMEESAVKEVL